MIMSDVFGDMDWMKQDYATLTGNDSDTGSAVGMDWEL